MRRQNIDDDFWNDEIINLSHIVLYGEKEYVNRIKYYFHIIYLKLDVETVIISKCEKSNDEFEFKEDNLNAIEKDTPIFVTTSLIWHNKITEVLKRHGFKKIFYYTPVIENFLRRKFLLLGFFSDEKKYNDIYQINVRKIMEPKKVEIYMSCCVVDKPLMTQNINNPICVIPVQAGASLTDKKIADISDNKGDNISEKNKRYSEMTVAYWAWKNSSADYIGLCHYRRKFIHPEIIVKSIQMQEIDAVLPLPTLYIESIKKEYFPRHIPDVWKIMLSVLEDFYPEYADVAERVFSGRYLYANNMWILKKSVLNEFFAWMYPMLEEIEKRVGKIEETYYNRYVGFCTELLTTLYFIENRKRLNIAHAEKTFIL